MTLGGLELGRHLHAQLLEQLDALAVRQQRAARRAGVEVGAEIRRAAQELRERLRRRVERVHLAAQRLELGQRDVARAALGARRRDDVAVRVEHGRRERLDALGGQRRHQDVRRRVQIVLRVPADELLVLGEGHVALDDAGAHARGGVVRLLGVLGELQRGAAVADREVGAARLVVEACQESLLERAVVHLVDEELGSRAELDSRMRAAEVAARVVVS